MSSSRRRRRERESSRLPERVKRRSPLIASARARLVRDQVQLGHEGLDLVAQPRLLEAGSSDIYIERERWAVGAPGGQERRQRGEGRGAGPARAAHLLPKVAQESQAAPAPEGRLAHLLARGWIRFCEEGKGRMNKHARGGSGAVRTSSYSDPNEGSPLPGRSGASVLLSSPRLCRRARCGGCGTSSPASAAHGCRPPPARAPGQPPRSRLRRRQHGLGRPRRQQTKGTGAAARGRRRRRPRRPRASGRRRRWRPAWSSGRRSSG